MKKIFLNLFLLIFVFFLCLISILATIGIETNRFNDIISKKINETNNKINLDLTTIKFKLDLKEISLYLETKNSKVNYKKTTIPAQNIKVYINFISLLKSNPKIKKISLVLNQLDINQLKEISESLKPSNFTSFLNNKIKKGKLNTELEIYLNEKNLLDNFIARGSFENLTAEIFKDITLEKTNFNFFADKSDILLKNIFSELGSSKLTNGNLRLHLSPEISLETSFKTNLKYNDQYKKILNLFKGNQYIKNTSNFQADLNNTFTISFDKTYKVKNYNFKCNGKIYSAVLDFKKPFDNFFLDKSINQLLLTNSKIKTTITPIKNSIDLSGNYSLDKEKVKLLSFNLKSVVKDNIHNLKLDADYKQPFELDFINYKKSKDSIAKIFLNLDKQKNKTKIKTLNIIDGNNSIKIKDLKFNEGKFSSFKNISFKTSKHGKINNDFNITYDKKILIKGKNFDASNLPKFFKKKKSNNQFSYINKDIDINFTNIIAPLSENLKNFKLIGRIEKGKFTKISSKGDFGKNNFLDISMKEDEINKKNYLEIYSDLTRPLLTEYSFFNGLTGGKLLYTSIIEKNSSTSKLKIENFKLINAPGMIKLLSLADLGGLADLAKGEGLSFDILEINMSKKDKLLEFNEIIAIGPSISVLMDGYQSSTITSLRGTLVPAKNLNKIISKIPILGDIVIPKEVGEGLFGISFKMKGPSGKIKTSINPIKTITPRFIQKIMNKKKTK